MNQNKKDRDWLILQPLFPDKSKFEWDECPDSDDLYHPIKNKRNSTSPLSLDDSDSEWEDCFDKKDIPKTVKIWIRPISPSTTNKSESDWDRCFNSDDSMPDPMESEDSDSESEPPFKINKYKKVSDKVRPIAGLIPEHLQPRRCMPRDPLLTLPILPHHPPTFHPTAKITTERMEELDIDNHKELLPEERKLLQHILRINERSIAFGDGDIGTFHQSYFTDYRIPVVGHRPWVEKNIPLAKGRYNDIIRALKDKIRAGVYEEANTVYRSRWFGVGKKDGGIRLVHDLQSLNKVTLRDSAVPPIADEFIEDYAGRMVYTVLDMYGGFHARVVDRRDRDLTAFQTPLGSLRLTSLPMGYSNAPAEFQASMMFILHEEVPQTAGVFIDDVPIKGTTTKYIGPNGVAERIPQNPGIRRYIWEHLQDVHRILHRMGEAGGTFSAKKMQLCQSEVTIIGQKCSAKGREPVDARIKKILNWPTPRNLTEVRGFLGLCGTVRIWIKNYSLVAKPLVDLTRNKVPFRWRPIQRAAFNWLKIAVTQAPALRPIDYTSDRPVILSVDSSIHGIGFILSQEDALGRRAPARYGSIPINEVEARYPQSKLELYGLSRALHRFRAHIVGVKKLIVEVDASSIKGMLKNPDIQVNAVMNRWIGQVLQYDFELIHVPAARHKGPDALSRRRYTKADEGSEHSNPEDWMERVALKVRTHSPPDSEEPSTPSPDSEEETPLPSPPSIPPDGTKPPPRTSSYSYTNQDMVDILTYLVSNNMPLLKTSRERKQFQNRARPFFLKQAHMYRHQPGHPPQVVIFPEKRRKEILEEMHEDAGHHGAWAVEQHIALRYFWPDMKNQIKHHVQSCHPCQLRSTKKMHIPVTISHPPCLFSKVYLDVMNMPLARRKRWLVGCRDDLSGVTECKALVRDTGKAICQFFLKRIILRYGMVQEVVTDNGPSFGQEFSRLLAQYGIRHIKISPYNSQANGVVERGHYNIREALIKLCDGNLSLWPLMVPAATYADRITVRRATGFSPYYLLHGTHPIMPGDLADATFLVTDYKPGMSSAELIQARTRQLLRLPQDIEKARQILSKSRFRSKKAFEKKFTQRLKTDPYQPGDLVLIRNNPIENSVSIERKTADKYMGPYQVQRRTQGGSYALAEMDGTPLQHHVAAFRLIPYVKRQDLDSWANQKGNDSNTEERSDQECTSDGDQDLPSSSNSDRSAS